LDFMVVAEYIPSPIIPINPSPASIGPSELIYRQIRKLRTLVLNFCILGML
jgi:hypothetical protein